MLCHGGQRQLLDTVSGRYFLEMEISALRHSDLVTDDDTLPA